MESPDNIENIQFSKTHEKKGRSRIKTRRAAVCHDAGWLEDRRQPGLAAAGFVAPIPGVKEKRSAVPGISS